MSSPPGLFRGTAPQALLRLLSRRPWHTAPAGECQFTVMFTDIVGFTGLAECLPPLAVAELITGHVAALTDRIERENGTVDKVLGDGVLAFWKSGGAYPAAPAVRSALAIRAAVEADNRQRVRHGLPPIRLRVGLHAGPLAMTAFGKAGRLGMTPLGDTVNVAQRLEQAGRHLDLGEEVTIVASEAVVGQAGQGFRFNGLGELPVRGRSQPVTAFRLG